MTDYADDYYDEDEWDEEEFLDDFESRIEDCGYDSELGFCRDIGSEYCSFFCPFHSWTEEDWNPPSIWERTCCESFADWGRRLQADGHLDNPVARRAYQVELIHTLWCSARSLLARLFVSLTGAVSRTNARDDRQQPIDDIPF